MVSRREAGSRRARARRAAQRRSSTETIPVLRITDQATVADVTVALCQRWFQLRAEADRLQTRWGDLEAWLGKHRGWYDRDAAQREDLQESRELDEIDARLDGLMAQAQALLQVLPGLAAPTPAAIAAKLQVAAKLIWPHDNLPALQLVLAATRDVTALSAPTGG